MPDLCGVFFFELALLLLLLGVFSFVLALLPDLSGMFRSKLALLLLLLGVFSFVLA